MNWWCALGCLVLVNFATSCAKRGEKSQGSGNETNLLVNPGFEEGREGWSRDETSALWGNFEIAESPTRSGRRSVHLAVDSSAGRRSRTKVFGVFQDITAHPFPARITGHYRAEAWHNDAEDTDLYIQVVAVAFAKLPSGKPLAAPTNHQIRYYLAGTPRVAIPISNAKVEIRSGDPPLLGEWVRFDLPIRRDFERLWGFVPNDYEKLRFLFEARWDNMQGLDSVVKADVYYDDLSVTPEDASTD